LSVSRVCSFCCYGCLRALLSFPTRRSSDLRALLQWLGQRPPRWDGRAIRRETGARSRRSRSRRLLRRPVPTVRFSTPRPVDAWRSEEHTSELQSRENLVCRLLLEKKKKTKP